MINIRANNKRLKREKLYYDKWIKQYNNSNNNDTKLGDITF